MKDQWNDSQIWAQSSWQEALLNHIYFNMVNEQWKWGEGQLIHALADMYTSGPVLRPTMVWTTVCRNRPDHKNFTFIWHSTYLWNRWTTKYWWKSHNII